MTWEELIDTLEHPEMLESSNASVTAAEIFRVLRTEERCSEDPEDFGLTVRNIMSRKDLGS